MLGKLGSFVRQNIGTSSDYERSGLSTGQKVAIAGGWAALTTAAGAAIGQARQAQDLVTITQAPVPETVRVQVGTAWTSHCSIPMQSGDTTWFMPSCYWDDPVVRDVPTGRILGYRPVENHSLGFPHSALQGAALGLGVGVLTGVAGLVLSEVLRK